MKDKTLILVLGSIAFFSVSILLYILYSGLMNSIYGFGYTTNIYMNKFNEFWFEFITLHFLLILLIYTFIKY